MSSRLIKTDAVILKTGKFGEMHKRVTLFTETDGILYANAYGASKGKSRLSGIVLPYAKVIVNLYYDPVRENYKITDAHPIHIHRVIHEDLKKYYAAGVVAEVLIKSFGGGEIRPFYELLSTSLQGLEEGTSEKSVYVLIQFFWRFIIISGFAPDYGSCSRCGKDLTKEPAVHIDVSRNESLCPLCSSPHMLSIERGGIQYLEHTSTLNFGQSCKVTLQRQGKDKVFTLLKKLIENIIEGKIYSLSLWEAQ